MLLIKDNNSAFEAYLVLYIITITECKHQGNDLIVEEFQKRACECRTIDGNYFFSSGFLAAGSFGMTSLGAAIFLTSPLCVGSCYLAPKA